MQTLNEDIKEKLIESVEKAFSTQIQNLEREYREADERLAENDYEKPHRRYDDEEQIRDTSRAATLCEEFLYTFKTSLNNSSTAVEVFDELSEFAKEFFQDYNEHDKRAVSAYVQFEEFFQNWYEFAELSSLEELRKIFQLSRSIDVDEDAYILYSEEFFKKILSSHIPEKDILRVVLEETTAYSELSKFCQLKAVVDKTLKNFILMNFDVVDHLDEIIKKSDQHIELDVYNIFDLIAFHTTHFRNGSERLKKDVDEEVLKLNEFNKYVVYSLDKNQRLELIEVLKNNEFARNTLIQIVENHLEDQYDFDTLKRILTKEDKKSLKTKFNF